MFRVIGSVVVVVVDVVSVVVSVVEVAVLHDVMISERAIKPVVSSIRQWMLFGNSFFNNSPFCRMLVEKPKIAVLVSWGKNRHTIQGLNLFVINQKIISILDNIVILTLQFSLYSCQVASAFCFIEFRVKFYLQNGQTG